MVKAGEKEKEKRWNMGMKEVMEKETEKERAMQDGTVVYSVVVIGHQNVSIPLISTIFLHLNNQHLFGNGFKNLSSKKFEKWFPSYYIKIEAFKSIILSFLVLLNTS